MIYRYTHTHTRSVLWELCIFNQETPIKYTWDETVSTGYYLLFMTYKFTCIILALLLFSLTLLAITVFFFFAVIIHFKPPFFITCVSIYILLFFFSVNSRYILCYFCLCYGNSTPWFFTHSHKWRYIYYSHFRQMHIISSHFLLHILLQYSTGEYSCFVLLITIELCSLTWLQV